MKKSNVKTKNIVGIALIYAILLGLFNLLVFTIFKTRTNVFWLSYAFVTLAFAVQIISMSLAFKTADVETVFSGFLWHRSQFIICVRLLSSASCLSFSSE